ncbi:MAG: hypothetical protein U7127_15590 [Phormidium sp.]
MRQNNLSEEYIQLELLKQTLNGWEPAFKVVAGYDWTTEQLERRFGIVRQELYKIKGKAFHWRSLILVFIHVGKNKWQVYKLKPFHPGE